MCWCVLFWLALQIFHAGSRVTLIESGQDGLKYFPDGGITTLPTQSGYRILCAAGVSSVLLEGPDLHSLHLTKRVLEPGPAGSFDNGYAGIYGAWQDPRNGEIIAVYHAEDHEGLKRLENGVEGFYASVALAISDDRGNSFRKAGPILTGSLPKDINGRPDQGCGEPSLLADRDGRYFYCFYTDHSRVDNRGVQICLARSAMADRGAPGSWRKYRDGAFTEPGLGGKDTPVMEVRPAADALFPSVSYSRKLGKYVMVFNILYYADLREGQPAKGGIFAAFSTDLLHWSTPELLVQGLSIAMPGREVLWHPAIVWDAGYLVYSYSPSWGHSGTRTPHYMVGQPLTFQ